MLRIHPARAAIGVQRAADVQRSQMQHRDVVGGIVGHDSVVVLRDTAPPHRALHGLLVNRR